MDFVIEFAISSVSTSIDIYLVSITLASGSLRSRKIILMGFKLLNQMTYLKIVLVIVAVVSNHICTHEMSMLGFKLKKTLLLYARNKWNKTIHSVKKLRGLSITYNIPPVQIFILSQCALASPFPSTLPFFKPFNLIGKSLKCKIVLKITR